MWSNMEMKTSSRHHQNDQMSRTVKEVLSPEENRSLDLQDRLKAEQSSSQSNIEEAKGDREGDETFVLPKTSRNPQKQGSDRKAIEHDELVKHMSNLPCYLQHIERGENIQEKALNFGVLDWRRLEKWKFNQKCGSEGSSTSTSNTSSSLSTVESLDGRICNGSPAHQRVQSPSLCSQNSSSTDGHSQCLKSYGANSVGLQRFKALSQNTSAGQQKLPRTGLPFGRIYFETKLEKSKRKDLDPKITPVRWVSSLNLKDCEVPLSSKGKLKAPDGEFENRTEQLPALGLDHPDQHSPGSPKNIIVLFPKGSSSCSGIYQQSWSTLPTEAGRKSFSPEKEVHFAELYSDIPHSCPLPCGVETSKQSDMKLPHSVDYQVTRVPSQAFSLFPSSHGREKRQSKNEDAERNKSTTNPAHSVVIEPSDKLGSQSAKVAASKVRYPSPSNQPSTGRMIRSFSYKEGSVVPQLSPTYVTAKSGPVRSDASVCSDNTNRDKTNTNGRGRSSPLRRLLDPLLKPKSANRLQFSQSLESSSSTRRASRSSDGPLDSTTLQSVKRNLTFSNCGPSNADDSHQEKLLASTMQALLHITIKNGHPLFTFAVDNNSDVLAATMKKVYSSVKDEFSWNYTFYSISETKKKSGGWINQGSKGKSHGYVSNVVGQMKVSTSHSPKLTTHDSKDHFLVNEFVLFGVELRRTDQGTPDLQPNSELAAIVVKVPKEGTGYFRNGQQSIDEDGSDTGFANPFPEDTWSCNSGGHIQNGSTVGTQSLPSAVVILPSGVHGLPSTGVPSPLIDRWKSGGSCDSHQIDLIFLFREELNRRGPSSAWHHSRKESTQLISMAQSRCYKHSLSV
uniref:Uncharacterized protein n=1 Tax=Nelumbo nucifera TaxID=4432 RepID=A0A822Y369_NELNU|nr:TPA_asm: hypothetical protein HUJ06_029832 [Nelumbo nucifera]